MVTARTDITIGASGVVEAFLCLSFALRVAGLERPLAMDPRLEEIAGLVAGQGEAAAGDAGFHDPTRLLRFFQEARLELPRRPQFASQEAERPLKVRRREAVRKVVGLGGEFRRAREGGLGFLGGEPLGPHHRLAVGRLQMQPPLALRFCGLDLVRLRQRREQRLRLGDLGHFRRRRKAFERGREDGVGIGGAGGRLVELGERKRRAQVEAARALLLSRWRWRSGKLLPRARGWRGRASAGFRRARDAGRRDRRGRST